MKSKKRKSSSVVSNTKTAKNMSDGIKGSAEAVVETEVQTLIPPINVIRDVIDFCDDGMILGFRYWVESEGCPVLAPLYITSDLTGCKVTTDSTYVDLNGKPYWLINSEPPHLRDRWNFEMIDAFLKKPSYPDDIFRQVKEIYSHFVEMPEPSEVYIGLLAAWTITTYFAHLFNAFPFLFFFGPKESGKSCVLELLSKMVINGTKVADITPAALIDTMDRQRGTLLYDQAESLSKRQVGIAADSYKRNGAKRRFISTKSGKRAVVEYSAYGPKALAAITELPFDLADRCCQINMQRSPNAYPDIMGNEASLLAIRDVCYRFQLLKWREVRDEYLGLESEEGTRRAEIWRPLEAVLRVLQVPQSEISHIRTLFNEGTAKTRHLLSPAIEALFHVLREKVGEKDTVEVPIGQLIEEIKPLVDQFDMIKPNQLGQVIKQYDLAKEGRKRGRKKLVVYTFEKNRVLDVTARYVKNRS